MISCTFDCQNGMQCGSDPLPCTCGILNPFVYAAGYVFTLKVSVISHRDISEMSYGFLKLFGFCSFMVCFQEKVLTYLKIQ